MQLPSRPSTNMKVIRYSYLPTSLPTPSQFTAACPKIPNLLLEIQPSSNISFPLALAHAHIVLYSIYHDYYAKEHIHLQRGPRPSNGLKYSDPHDPCQNESTHNHQKGTDRQFIGQTSGLIKSGTLFSDAEPAKFDICHVSGLCSAYFKGYSPWKKGTFSVMVLHSLTLTSGF